MRDGERWDNLNGIFDLHEYVTFMNYANKNTAGVVKVDDEKGLSVDAEGNLSVVFSAEGEIDSKDDASVLSPATIDYAILKSTHQRMSDDYAPTDMPVGQLAQGSEGKLPVSYDAVKEYIDSRQASGEVIEVSGDYQPITDESFNTDAKTVSGAINELNDKIDVIACSLEAGWNIVKLNTLYPVSWIFSGKPFCYTEDGYSVDFRIRHLNNYIVDNVHAFEIYVPEACELRCCVSACEVLLLLLA